MRKVEEKMLALIEHFLENNAPVVIGRSLLNCHARDLHSIMLMEKPGQTIRMFFADKDHTLWRNEPDSKALSVAFHPHHCSIRLHKLFGKVSNVRACLESAHFHSMTINRYRWNSPITGGSGTFTDEGPDKLHPTEFMPLFETRLPADAIHTIHVPRGEMAAWMVYEGAEDKNYQPLCWAHSTPKIEPEFYTPMTFQALHDITEKLCHHL